MDTEARTIPAGSGAAAAEEDYVRILSDPSITGKTAEEQMQELNEKMLAKNFTMQGKPFPTFLGSIDGFFGLSIGVGDMRFFLQL